MWTCSKRLCSKARKATCSNSLVTHLHASAVQWSDLMTQLSVKYPDATARIICDFLNEPDFGNLRWEAQPDQGLPGMKDMYLNAMDEVYNITNSEHLSTASQCYRALDLFECQAHGEATCN